jgi:mono/diheme cytochrome c family protein
MGVLVSKLRRLPSLMAVAPALALAGPCYAQGNIDAGKSPAQIFADTCAVCHRDAREMRRSSAAYLRQHYTSSYDEAVMMAGYLARLPPPEPRAAQSKRGPAAAGVNPAETARQLPAQQPTTADQAKSAQAQPKGRRAGATSEARASPQPASDENSPTRLPVSEPQTSAPAAQLPLPTAQPSPRTAPAALVPFQE